jgi:hypothetical protein
MRIWSVVAFAVVGPALAGCAHRDTAPMPGPPAAGVDECPIVGAFTRRVDCDYGVAAVYAPVVCYCAERQFGVRHWICPFADEWVPCPNVD